jgi:hypothetical protein
MIVSDKYATMPTSFQSSADTTASSIVGQWTYWDAIAFDQYSRYSTLQTITTDDGVTRPGFPYSINRTDILDTNYTTPGRELFDRPTYEWELPYTTTFTYTFNANGTYAIHKQIQHAQMPVGYMQQTYVEVGTYTTTPVDYQGRNVVVVALNPVQSAQETYKDLDNFYNSSPVGQTTTYLMLRRDFNPNSGTDGLLIAPVVPQANGDWTIQPPNPNDIFVPIPYSNQLGIHVANLVGDPVPVDLNKPLIPPVKSSSGQGMSSGNSNGVGNNSGREFLGTNGNDVLTGSANHDLLLGLDGNDWIAGGDGNDSLKGGKGKDKLVGGKGNDKLWGGANSDSLIGNAGRDVFVLETGIGRDVIKDFSDRIDKIGLTPALSFKKLAIAQQGKNTVISMANNNDVLAVLIGVQARQITAADFVTIAAN